MGSAKLHSRQGCSGFGRMRNSDERLSSKFTLSEDFEKDTVQSSIQMGNF